MKLRLPRLECYRLCGFNPPLQRFHVTCLICRRRRYCYGKMDKKKYRLIANGRLVLPTKRIEVSLKVVIEKLDMHRVRTWHYTILVDEWRRLHRIKDILMLKTLLYGAKCVDHRWNRIAKLFLSFSEILAN